LTHLLQALIAYLRAQVGITATAKETVMRKLRELRLRQQ